MPIDFDFVPVKSTRLTSGHSLVGGQISFHKSEQLRKDYTDAMMQEHGFTRETAEQLHSVQVDSMVYGVDWGDPAGDQTAIIPPQPTARQPEPIMQTLRVTYRASTTDGEITDSYDLLTHRRYVRTITETLREIGDHINRIYISGPRYGTVRCIERFLEALIAVTYLKGQCLMSITEISIL